MLYNVRCSMLLDDIEASLTRVVRPPGQFTALKEGAPNRNAVKGRNIFFRVNQQAFEQLFTTVHGAIPFLCLETQTRAKLYPRINCRPFVCKRCFAIGAHTCKGMSCATCGSSGHSAATCRRKTRACSNCLAPGHRARDAHCPTYLAELARELRTMDLPVQWMRDEEKRHTLVRLIQLV